MDALDIQKAILAGFDWGSRTGDIIAALWPQRCKALVSVSGYLITNLVANPSRCRHTGMGLVVPVLLLPPSAAN